MLDSPWRMAWVAVATCLALTGTFSSAGSQPHRQGPGYSARRPPLIETPSLPEVLQPAARQGGYHVQEQYLVNAQFRGGVTKSFDNLGGVDVDYRELPDRSYVVALAGTIHDPEEEGRSYRFKAAIEFDWLGSTISARARSEFSADAEEYRDRILEVAPFVHIVKHSAFPPPDGPRELSYRMNGRPYSLRYSGGERHVEVTLYEDLRTLAKFFVVPGSSAGPHEFEKYRINTVNQTVLSFVRNPPPLREEDRMKRLEEGPFRRRR